MYQPNHFAENREEQLHALMRDHPFATMIFVQEEYPEVNHLPLQLSEDGKYLHGHLAKANPLCAQEFDKDSRILLVFHGPHAYITPSWYPSKKISEKVVPTWNYAVVHVDGRPKWIKDSSSLLQLLSTLTDHHEATRQTAWKISDAPSDYIDKMLEAIVGIEIEITRISGKFKLSQNRNTEDRNAVIEHLSKGDESNQVLANLSQSIQYK